MLPVVLAALLTACAGMSRSAAELAGRTESDVVARWGVPETRRPIDGGGARLEYPGGPYGRHTWFVTLDATGRVSGAEQVLTEANFLSIAPGMAQDEVRRRLGRPGEVQPLGRDRGVVWRYRYENPFCLWFQVELSREQRVRSAGYGEPPECDSPNEIIIRP